MNKTPQNIHDKFVMHLGDGWLAFGLAFIRYIHLVVLFKREIKKNSKV